MFERFTDRATIVMVLANQEAQRFNSPVIDAEHLLLGLVKEDIGVACSVLENFGIDLRKVRLEVEKLIQPSPENIVLGRLPLSPLSKRVIALAIEEALLRNGNYIGTEHLLLGLMGVNEGIAAKVLLELKVSPDDIRKEVIILIGGEQRKLPAESPEEIKRFIAKLDIAMKGEADALAWMLSSSKDPSIQATLRAITEQKRRITGLLNIIDDQFPSEKIGELLARTAGDLVMARDIADIEKRRGDNLKQENDRLSKELTETRCRLVIPTDSMT